MELKILVGNVATVFTIAVFLSGIEICRKIWGKKSTCDISALPFICGLVSSSLWLRYGLLIDDSALIVVNSVGTFLQIIYLLWYGKYTVLRGNFYKQLMVGLFVIGILFYYTTFRMEKERARYVSGLASCSAGVIFMASPLASIANVMKTKSASNLPFTMILCTFIMAILWVCYGVLTDDLFVQVPNFLGACLALSQLCLFAVYPNNKPYLANTV